MLAWLVNGVFALFVAWAAAYWLRQWRGARRARRSTRELITSRTSGLAVGAMLMGFQAILQPPARHTMTEEQKEDVCGDESGHEWPGGRLFHTQLQQIRRGEETGDLTLQVDP